MIAFNRSNAMARRVSKSSLFGKYADRVRKATIEHRTDETNFGSGGDLPAGIEGGVAQLVDCKFDTYKRGDNTGETYFYAAGIVKEPKVHDGMRVEGLRTSIMEPICDTPNRSRATVEEHVEHVLNELRKLGVDSSELDHEDYEAVCESLKEEKPHFRFRTWRGDPTPQYPNPRTNEQWKGSCEYVEDGDVEDLVDETEEYEEPEEEEEPEESEAAELDGKAADAGDDEAIAAIQEAATAAGIDTDEYETWTEVVETLDGSEEPQEEAEEEEEETEEEETEEEDDWEPEKGEVYLFKPPRSRKAVEVEVTAVFKSKRTANVKALDDGRVFKSVSWDALSAD